MRNRAISLLLLGMFAALFAFFVWPTPYIYETTQRGLVIRINRFTQTVQKWDKDHWY